MDGPNFPICGVKLHRVSLVTFIGGITIDGGNISVNEYVYNCFGASRGFMMTYNLRSIVIHSETRLVSLRKFHSMRPIITLTLLSSIEVLWC